MFAELEWQQRSSYRRMKREKNVLCLPRLSASNYLHTQKDQKLSFLHRLTADTQRFGYSLSSDRSTMTSNGTFFYLTTEKSRTKKEQRQRTNCREFFIRKLPVVDNLLETAGER